MTILLTPSEIKSYLYCFRFTYFNQSLNISEHAEKRFKVQKGRELHLEKTQINKDYLRKKIGVTDKEIDVYLSSEKLHLKGIVDEVLTLNDSCPEKEKYQPIKTGFTQSLSRSIC